ncbi:MAG: substrate-binding domain-containing protein, partial [Tannerella sp.]|nr:substrate-binding domain-containing protein [Tannerella sp.]
MKKIIHTLATVSLLSWFSGNAVAQEIHIEGIKFVHPIVEKWVTEYKKEHPGTTFEVKVNPEKVAGAARISVVAGQVSGEDATGREKVVYAGRYALLPVSNRNNPLIGKVGKGLKKKE